MNAISNMPEPLFPHDGYGKRSGAELNEADIVLIRCSNIPNSLSRDRTRPSWSSAWASCRNLFSLFLVLTLANSNIFAQETSLQPAVPSEAKEEKELPKTSVQIVNATSVPEISLMVDEQMYYPKFPQGLYTGDAPTPKLKPKYTATDLFSKTKVEHQITYESDTQQSLIITGDFQLVAEEEELSEDTPDKKSDEPELKPRVHFQVFSHDLENGEQPLRYRFHNGLVDQRIIINDGETAQWVEPGKTLNFYGQPMIKTFTATINKEMQTVLIRQEGTPRNCTVIFYEKNGKPTFMRAFENTRKSLEIDMQAEASGSEVLAP